MKQTLVDKNFYEEAPVQQAPVQQAARAVEVGGWRLQMFDFIWLFSLQHCLVF